MGGLRKGCLPVGVTDNLKARFISRPIFVKGINKKYLEEQMVQQYKSGLYSSSIQLDMSNIYFASEGSKTLFYSGSSTFRFK